MSVTYDVYGIGHALVDIQHRISVDFLAKLQIEKGIMTLVDEGRQLELIQALNEDPVKSASGGSAANTMIGIAQFGGRAYYAYQVGQDEWGKFYQDDLEKAGVQSNTANRVKGPTGKCLVFITPDADRTLNSFLGVSGNLGPEQIEEDAISASKFIYLEGYLLSSENGFAACCRAQQLAQKHQTAVSLTLSDPAMVSFCKERFEQIIEGGVDLLFCNEEEAQALTGAANREGSGRALAARVRSACITCGADGALIYGDGQRFDIPGFPVKAVDTTGAGDMFAGGVLFGLTNGFGFSDAGKLGSYAAAQVVARYGPRLEANFQNEAPKILAQFS
ncbi:MAG: adenosine kinase [Gemmatimonadetes bacterium]|nr:adenosine kinase [Gemmatimonadota bacterium]